MIEIDGEIKKWGNSIGLRMKKSLLRSPEIGLNRKVKAILIPEKNLKVKDLLGRMKTKVNTEKIMREIDKEADIDF